MRRQRRSIKWWIAGWLAPALLVTANVSAQKVALRWTPPVDQAAQKDQNQDRVPLKQMLTDVEQQYNVKIIYQSDLVEERSVPVRQVRRVMGVSKIQLERAVLQLVSPMGLKFRQYKQDYYILQKQPKLPKVKSGALDSTYPNPVPRADTKGMVRTIQPLRSYEKTITGRVTDLSTGEALPGVNVVVKNTTVGTVTDIDGNYRLTAPDDAQTLVFSSVGYTSEEVAINNNTVINLNMAPDIQSLSEVVVVGYGTQKKRDLTGAVSSVKTENVQRAVTTSAEEIMQGRIAGVTVSQSSNAPGGGITVRVRGTSSISGGSDPLYVIDGVPIANSDQQNNTQDDLRFSGRNPSLSPLALLNPQDIASIEVLKDASATAIYGARGANGVVLITTKKGTSGGAAVELSTSYGIQEAILLPELLDAQQFVALNDEARTNAGQDAVFNGQTPPYNTDWQNELYRTAPVQNHSLSVRGGNDATTYAVSIGYFNQQGVVTGTGLKRYSARLNLEQKATDWLRIGVNANFSRTDQDNSITSGSASVTRNVNQMAPIGPVRIGNEWFSNTDMLVEDYMFGLPAANVAPLDNPIFFSEVVRNQSINDRILGSVFAEISFSEKLKFRTMPGVDLINGRTFFFVPTTAISGNRALNQYNNTTHWSIQNQLTYQDQIGKHNINATLVQSAEQFRFNRLEALAENISDATGNFNFDGDTRLDNDKFPSADNWSIASFLGRVTYDYANKYLLTASVRYDGSSRFGAERRWGLFPAVSAGWVISDEAFFPEAAVSFLKLRAGYGVNGSQDINPFLYKSLVRGTRAVINGNLFPGYEPSNLPNELLGWESTQQINLGLDAGFFNDRLTLAANVYDKLTTDLLFRTDVPLTSGQENIVLNVGEVRNQGFEVELGGYVIDGPFSWQTAINYSRNNNTVEALDGIVEEVIDVNQQQNRSFILQPGLPLNTYFGYETGGLWQETDDVEGGTMPGARPGDRRYVDVSGDTAITGQDRKALGSEIPISSFGFNNTFRFKGLELNIFLQGLAGMDKLNGLKVAMENTTGTVNTSTRVLDRWTPQNTNTQVEAALQGGRRNVPPNADFNTYFIEDASFVRLKNITLSYNLPTTLAESLGLSRVRLSITGQNLATFTNFSVGDPEAGAGAGAYPLVRTYTFGLNVGL